MISTYTASREERSQAAACLEPFVLANRAVGFALVKTPPLGGSLEPSGKPGVTAAGTVSLHRAVANDHLASFTSLLQLENSPAPSMATLVRSCIEAWGRAWWVLAASSGVHAEYRARAMVVAELGLAASREVRMLNGLPIEDALASATVERDAVGWSEAESVPGYAKLATQVLLGTGSSEASTVYSHLSGVAHGESVFTSSLSSDPHAEGTSPASIELPAQNLASYCSWLVGVTSISTLTLMRAWPLQQQLLDLYFDAMTTTISLLPAAPGDSVPG